MNPPTNLQWFGQTSVRIIANKIKSRSDRFAQITPPNGRPYSVPVDLLGLMAGKDVWMRDIRVKCLDCREPHRIGDMEGQLCEACVSKCEEENQQANA